ncbi:MAG: PaREP1 family protein [Dehalococcoidia bacterium]|nr:PaREP1 family protein [Dehalococcoidia bacterium]
MEKVNNYVGLNNKYLREADTLVRQGNYVQASEKFWGAAAEMVKAVAAKRGIDLRSHGELYQFATKLSQELNNRELIRLFGLASALHQNFYENRLPAEMVIDYGEAVKELVELLRKLV